MQLEIYTAEVVYNGLGTPQAKAGVLIQDSGRGSPQIMNITGMEALAEIAADIEMDFPIKDKGFAISPAPVNAYIDLTGVSLADVEVVLEKVQASGVSVVGIVTDDVAVMEFLLEQPLSGVIHWQVQSSNPQNTETILNTIVEQLRSFKSKETDFLKVGLAFANTYSVSKDLLVKLAQLCKQNKLPLQIGVSQTQAEQDLFTSGDGGLLNDVLEQNPKWQTPKLSPIQYLNKIGVLDAQPSLVHMTYADEEDIRLVQYAGCTVIYCPREENSASNDEIRFPWEIYMKHGAEVAFGTGVKGSRTQDFDVREDVKRALQIQQEKMSPLAAIRSAVKGGYRALKMKPPVINKGDGVDKLYIW